MADPKDLKAWIKDPNTRTALTFLQRQGWSPAQASGIVANLQYESGLDPTRPGDGGAAYGMRRGKRTSKIGWAHRSRVRRCKTRWASYSMN